MIKQRFKWLTLLIYVPLLTLNHLSAPNSEELVDAAYAHTGSRCYCWHGHLMREG